MPLLSCCCSKTEKEQEINHIYKGESSNENTKLKVQESIKKYNELTGSHAYHYKERVFTLSEETILNPAHCPYLFKDIVIDYYRNNVLKVGKELIDDLDAVCSCVKTLQNMKRLRAE